MMFPRKNNIRAKPNKGKRCVIKSLKINLLVLLFLARMTWMAIKFHHHFLLNAKALHFLFLE